MDAGPNEEILTAHGVQAIIETNDLEVDQETPAEEMSETAAEPENPAVSGLIEKGFIHKFNHDLAEAAMFFAEALEICRDYELKYMLAMETVTLYKELGRYDDAEQVLQRYISKADRHAIIDEINLQLSYIRILNSELNRLGIPGTPIARVPRWVRINVDEQMKAKNA
jgi:tetratricopeptide (TPR) repeat protein